MQRFTIPRDVYTGDNAIDVLKTIEGKKAFIVIGSDRTLKDGTVKKVQANLKEANIESRVFQGVEHDPSVATVQKGTEALKEYGADWVIGIGGGSPIDAAKSMWLFYEHPELSFEDTLTPFTLPTLRQKAKFIGITTTSGTATEVTSLKLFDIPHGCANAIYLPYVIQYNAKTAPEKYADIAHRLGLSGITEGELVDSLVNYIKELKQQMNVPASLKEFNVDLDDFMAQLDFFAPEAVQDPCTGTNPRTIDDETMKKLYLCAYHGEDVQF